MPEKGKTKPLWVAFKRRGRRLLLWKDPISPGLHRKSAVQTRAAEQTNKWAAEQRTAAGAKAGTISRAAGPPDKSPGRWPYLKTAEPLGSGGQPGPPQVRLCFGLLTRSARWTDWRMGRRHLSKQVKARARTPEQVLHSLAGFHKEEDSWWISCTGVHLLI